MLDKKYAHNINRILSQLNTVRTQVEISPMITITDDNDVVLYFLHYAPNKGNDIHLIIAEVIQPPTGIVYFKDEIGNTTRATISAGLYNLTLELYGSDGNALKRQMSQLRINKTKPYIEVVN